MLTSQLRVERVPKIWFLLVKKFYQQHYPSGKPNKADPIWILKNQDKILSAVRLKQFINYQLLTAMVTAPDFRHKGLGKYLLRSIRPALIEKHCYCFAYSHLCSFYSSNGFMSIEIEQLPNELQQRFRAYTAHGRKLIPMRYIG